MAGNSYNHHNQLVGWRTQFRDRNSSNGRVPIGYVRPAHIYRLHDVVSLLKTSALSTHITRTTQRRVGVWEANRENAPKQIRCTKPFCRKDA